MQPWHRFVSQLTRRIHISYHSRRYTQSSTQSETSQASNLTIDLHDSPASTQSAFKTLYMRYLDTLDPSPVLNDSLSASYLDSFIYSPQHLPPQRPAVSSVLEPYRAKLIDLLLAQWLRSRHANHILNIESRTRRTKQILDAEHATAAAPKSVLHVIELGVGFDARFERIFLEHADAAEQSVDGSSGDESDSDAEDFELSQMPSIASRDSRVGANDFDVVFFYELDVNNVIAQRKALHLAHGVEARVAAQNERYAARKKKVSRALYSYSVLDENWVAAVKADMARNHVAETGREMEQCLNVCLVAESLFLFLEHREMKQLIERCCDAFCGAHFVCDESFTNQGLMSIEREVLRLRRDRYDVANKLFPLKLEEIKRRLSFLVRWTVGYLARNHYKILDIQFMKGVQSQRRSAGKAEKSMRRTNTKRSKRDPKTNEPM